MTIEGRDVRLEGLARGDKVRCIFTVYKSSKNINKKQCFRR
jgi:hypothetical protein